MSSTAPDAGSPPAAAWRSCRAWTGWSGRTWPPSGPSWAAYVRPLLLHRDGTLVEAVAAVDRVVQHRGLGGVAPLHRGQAALGFQPAEDFEQDVHAERRRRVDHL